MAFSTFEPSRSKTSLFIGLTAVFLVFISFIIGVQFGKKTSTPMDSNLGNHIVNHDNPLGNQLNDAYQDIPGVVSPNMTPVTPAPSPPEPLYMIVIGPLGGQNEKNSNLLIRKINQDANLTAITTKYRGNNFWVRLVPSYSESEGNLLIQQLKKKGFTASLQSEKR